MTKKAVKRTPIGKEEGVELTYTNFAANQERTQLQTGEGREFENDILLEMLGFKKDENGNLRISTNNHKAQREDNGEISIRKAGNKILTQNKTQRDVERD